jgi:hypothetical protein
LSKLSRSKRSVEHGGEVLLKVLAPFFPCVPPIVEQAETDFFLFCYLFIPPILSSVAKNNFGGVFVKTFISTQ